MLGKVTLCIVAINLSVMCCHGVFRLSLLPGASSVWKKTPMFKNRLAALLQMCKSLSEIFIWLSDCHIADNRPQSFMLWHVNIDLNWWQIRLVVFECILEWRDPRNSQRSSGNTEVYRCSPFVMDFTTVSFSPRAWCLVDGGFATFINQFFISLFTSVLFFVGLLFFFFQILSKWF